MSWIFLAVALFITNFSRGLAPLVSLKWHDVILFILAGNIMDPHASYRGFPNATQWLLASTSTYAIGVHLTSISCLAGCQYLLQKRRVSDENWKQSSSRALELEQHSLTTLFHGTTVLKIENLQDIGYWCVRGEHSLALGKLIGRCCSI